MSKSPRLDLSAYDQEDISQRTRPVVQDCTPDCRLPTIGTPCPRSLAHLSYLPPPNGAPASLVCSTCGGKGSEEGNPLVRCDGCPWAYHVKCRGIPEEECTRPAPAPPLGQYARLTCPIRSAPPVFCPTTHTVKQEQWYCTPHCKDSLLSLQCGTTQHAYQQIQILRRSRAYRRAVPRDAALRLFLHRAGPGGPQHPASPTVRADRHIDPP